MQSLTFRILLLLRFWIFSLHRDAFFLFSYILIAIECIGLNGTLLSMSHGSEDIIPVPFMVEQEWTNDTHFSPILCAPQPFFNHSVFKMYSGLFNRAFYGCTSEKQKKGKKRKKKKLHYLDFSGDLVTEHSPKSSRSTSSHPSMCRRVPGPPLKPFFPRVVS